MLTELVTNIIGGLCVASLIIIAHSMYANWDEMRIGIATALVNSGLMLMTPAERRQLLK